MEIIQRRAGKRSLSRQSAALVTAFSFLFVLVGCGSNPQKTLDPAAAVGIRNVAITLTDSPEKASVSPHFGNDAVFMAGFLGGLVGSAIAGATYSAILSKQSDAYQEALSTPMPDMEAVAAESLIRKVGKSQLRFEVVRLTGELASKRDITPEELGLLELPKDAFLQVNVSDYGYASNGKGYQPFLMGSAQLVRKGSTEAIYTAYIRSPELFEGMSEDSYTPIHTEPGYFYSTTEELYKDADRAQKGIIAMARRMGEMIASDLQALALSVD